MSPPHGTVAQGPQAMAQLLAGVAQSPQAMKQWHRVPTGHGTAPC